MKKIICFILMLMFLMFGVAYAGTVNLPQTGQKKCYDTNGTEIPCPGTGQDGANQAGVGWPAPRFQVNGDCVTDSLTGLIWAKDANLPGSTRDWYEAVGFCNNLTLCGYTDWRLPNVNELESLINANEANSATWLNAQGFTNVQASSYWSSTTYAVYQDYAWIVAMWIGYVGYDDKSSYPYNACVWPVRGGQQDVPDLAYPANISKTGQTTSYATGDDGDLERGVAWPSPRFADHGNGTVTDNLTGLMWTKNANLPNGYRTWQQALDYVSGMNAGAYPNLGYTDWRLPNRKELHSLTDYSTYIPALPAGHPFTNVQAYHYWSSTTDAYDPVYAWVVDMWDGDVSYDNKPDAYSYYVWPVRSGQIPTLIEISSFTAAPSDRAVILKWTTATEIDNAGFNLYRLESENGEYVKINSSLIPAEGTSTSGATYQFIDSEVKNRTTYYYKLEDIDINGVSTLHGPVSATPRVIHNLR